MKNVRKVVNGVVVINDMDIPLELLESIVEEEKLHMKKRGFELGMIEIKDVGLGEVEITAKKKSIIKRLRRITGYLSEIDNFNAAKKAELRDRIVHVSK